MPWVKPHNLFVCLVTALIAGTAGAQSLDLDVAMPAQGASMVHRTVADELKQTATTMRASDPDREDNAKAAIRELASALIERGLRRPSDGAELLIAGLTLAAHAPLLDAGLQALDPADRTTIAADSRRLAATLTDDPEAVDRSLRDALALLTGSITLDPNAGWLGRDTPAPETSALNTSVDRDPVSSAPGLLRLIEEARTDQAYRPSADRLARRLQAASMVLDLPTWVANDARAALAQRFAEAVRQSLGGNAIDAATELDAMAQLAKLMLALEALPLNEHTQLARAHAESIAVSPDPIPLRRVNSGLGLAQLAGAPEPAPLPKSFVRDLRPAWTRLMDRSKDKQEALLPYLTPALRDTLDADPGYLAALSAARRSSQRFTDLHALNAHLKVGLAADSPAVAHRDHRMLAGRAAKLGRESPTLLWKLADQSRRFAQLPAEQIWRDPAIVRTGWIRAIDALLPEIALAADRLREQWEGEWSSGDEAQTAAAELDSGIRLLTILDAISTAQQADRSGWRLTTWPGWHHDRSIPLSPTLVGDAASLAVLVAAWTDPLTRVDEEALSKAEARFAAVRAVAKLEKTVADLGRSNAVPTLSSILTMLGLGSPDPHVDLLAPHRAEIAELNRRVLEAVAFHEDENRSEQALEYANDAAKRLLQRLK